MEKSKVAHKSKTSHKLKIATDLKNHELNILLLYLLYLQIKSSPVAHKLNHLLLLNVVHPCPCSFLAWSHYYSIHSTPAPFIFSASFFYTLWPWICLTWITITSTDCRFLNIPFLSTWINILTGSPIFGYNNRCFRRVEAYDLKDQSQRRGASDYDYDGGFGKIV